MQLQFRSKSIITKNSVWSHLLHFSFDTGYRIHFLDTFITVRCIGPFEFKVEGRSKTAGTAEGCDFWDQNGVLLLHLRVQQQRKSKINEFTMSDGIE